MPRPLPPRPRRLRGAGDVAPAMAGRASLPSLRRPVRVLEALVLAYVAAVFALVAILDGDTYRELAHSLALSPDRLGDERLELFAASALTVAGTPWTQLPVLALLAWMTVDRLGAGWFWASAVAGHVGSTLVAYAGLGWLWILDGEDEAWSAPDYGISCVVAGALGAVCVHAARTGGRGSRLLAVTAATAWVAYGVIGADGLVAVEHGSALLLGAGVGLLATRQGPTSEVAQGAA